MKFSISADGSGTSFDVKVVPGASRDRIVGALGDALKVAVRQPPEAGRANRAVMGLIATALRIPPSDVRIERGETTPRKRLFVSRLTPQEIAARLGVS